MNALAFTLALTVLGPHLGTQPQQPCTLDVAPTYTLPRQAHLDMKRARYAAARNEWAPWVIGSMIVVSGAAVFIGVSGVWR